MDIKQFIGDEQVTKLSFFVSAFQAIELIEEPQERLLGFETIMYYAFYGIEPDVKTLPNSVASVYLTNKPIIDNSINAQLSGKKGGSRRQKKEADEESENTLAEKSEAPLENISNHPSEISASTLEKKSEPIRNRNSNRIRNSNRNKDKDINYQKIVDAFNDICCSFPKMTKLSEQRKSAIRARVSENDEETVLTVFRMAEDSDFLSGRNGKWTGTRCGFDWIMKPTNFIKILEGNYSQSRSSPNTQSEGNPFLLMYEEEMKGQTSYEPF